MDDLILKYNGGKINAEGEEGRVLADGVSFNLRKGESLALIGETGSGKTMTALSIMRLLPAGVSEEGEAIEFMGSTLPKEKKVRELLGTQMVYIPQNGAESLDPSRKVRKQLYDNLKKLGISQKELQKNALEKLSLAGFEDPASVMDKYPFQLSGGMAQRVTIALAACSHAKLIIADEPSNGLDEDFAEDFLTLVRGVFPGAAILMITHDISMASGCGNIAVLCGGKIMEKGRAQEVLDSPKSPYTKALIAALPSKGMKQTPVLRRGSSGCPFYERCPDAGSYCLEALVWQGSDEQGWRCCAR